MAKILQSLLVLQTETAIWCPWLIYDREKNEYKACSQWKVGYGHGG